MYQVGLNLGLFYAFRAAASGPHTSESLEAPRSISIEQAEGVILEIKIFFIQIILLFLLCLPCVTTNILPLATIAFSHGISHL